MHKPNKESMIEMLERLSIAEQAWSAYMENKVKDDLINYLNSVPEFPKDKLPKGIIGINKLINVLIRRFGSGNTPVKSKDFEIIQRDLDHILRLDAGPDGALLQNLIRACMDRIADLENTSSTKNADRNVETAIVKYISEIRNLISAVNDMHKVQLSVRDSIRNQVNRDIETVMDAVKEVVSLMMPLRIDDFKRLLSAKLPKL